MGFFKKSQPPSQPNSNIKVEEKQQNPTTVKKESGIIQEKVNAEYYGQYYSDTYPETDHYYSESNFTKPNKTNSQVIYPKAYAPKPLYERQSAIIIAVEASKETNEYITEITKLITKIISDNHDKLFMFIKISNEFKASNLCKCNVANVNQIIAKLTDLTHNPSNSYCLGISLQHLEIFAKDYLNNFKIFTLNEKTYVIEEAKIIFIGTGKTENSIINPIIPLEMLTNCPKIKAIKYFCIKDCNAIQVAKLGFPVIGHIDSNFYK